MTAVYRKFHFLNRCPLHDSAVTTSARLKAKYVQSYRAAVSEFRALGITTRAINVLFRSGISSLSDVENLSEQDLARLSGIGPQTIARLKANFRDSDASCATQEAPEPISVQFGPEILTAIDDWSKAKGLTRSQAVLSLVEQAFNKERL
jgi:hypothetical protein